MHFVKIYFNIIGVSNGHSNGHANGHMNGHTNGHSNGHINGHSNGHINGHSNGHSNGVKSFHKNGATNGVKHEPTEENQFLYGLVDKMVKDVLEGSKDPGTKVVDFKHPKELSCLLDLSLNKPTADDTLLNMCDDIIRYSVKTGEVMNFVFVFNVIMLI